MLELLFRWALESITSVFLDTRLGCLEAEPAQEIRRLIENANTDHQAATVEIFPNTELQARQELVLSTEEG